MYSGKPFGVPGPGVGDPIVNGTVLVPWIVGGPPTGVAVPWMLAASPCGIVARRAIVGPSAGLVVFGMLIQMPGSRWSAPWVVRSLIVCR